MCQQSFTILTLNEAKYMCFYWKPRVITMTTSTEVVTSDNKFSIITTLSFRRLIYDYYTLLVSGLMRRGPFMIDWSPLIELIVA